MINGSDIIGIIVFFYLGLLLYFWGKNEKYVVFDVCFIIIFF